VIPKRLLAENMACLSMVSCVSLKHLRKLDKWKTKRRNVRPKKQSTADEQYVMSYTMRWLKDFA